MGFEASDYLLESALKPLPHYNDTGSVIQSMSNNEGELWKASFLHHIALGFCLGKKKKYFVVYKLLPSQAHNLYFKTVGQEMGNCGA